MARQVSPWLMRWLLIARRREALSGFTLLELLVALLIGSIIVSALLYGLVEILQTNQRESSRAETQREMQLALDYISSDIRESVFVYDGDCLRGATSGPARQVCRGLLSGNVLPAAINSADKVPVLAMWRVDELPQVLIDRCRANATSINLQSPPAAIQGVPCLSRRNYTLVVYYLDRTNPTGRWQGKARLRRYELSQFANDGSRNQGWVDPTSTNKNFLGWPFDSEGTNLQTAATLPGNTPNPRPGPPVLSGEAPALVDFIDDPTADTGATIECPKTGTSASQTDFVLSPPTGSTSFFACVRGGGILTSGSNAGASNNAKGLNQEVYLFLRGNAAGRPGISSDATSAKFEMETRVLARGSYGKTPAE